MRKEFEGCRYEVRMKWLSWSQDAEGFLLLAVLTDSREGRDSRNSSKTHSKIFRSAAWAAANYPEFLIVSGGTMSKPSTHTYRHLLPGRLWPFIMTVWMSQSCCLSSHSHRYLATKFSYENSTEYKLV